MTTSGGTGEAAAGPGAGSGAPTDPGAPTALAAPTVFVLLRHGETVFTVERRFSGSGGTDPGLSERGRWQARRAADAPGVRGGGVQVVVSSPLARCRETARVVAARLSEDGGAGAGAGAGGGAGVRVVAEAGSGGGSEIGSEAGSFGGGAGREARGEVRGEVRVEVEPGLRETDFGSWEGLTFAEVRQRYPAELDAWLTSSAAAPPGGESFDDVTRRVTRTRDRLLARHPGRALLLVSHVTPIKTLARLALGAPPQSLFRMDLSPASLSAIAYFPDGHASLRHLNDTGHLR